MARYDYNQTAVLRDVQVAQEIRSMAALGQFPQEITAYGLVYYRAHRRHYLISQYPDKLIGFLNDAANQAYFPTHIDSYTQRLAVPEGSREEIVRSIKLKLAQWLQQDYPESLFVGLTKLAETAPNDSAETLLLDYRRELESVFSPEKIRAFADLCTKAYWRKSCSLAVYQTLTAWCGKRLAQLDSCLPPVGARTKRFYGLAVLQDQQIQRTIINANLSCIYQEKRALEEQGQLTTIWHQHSFDVPRQESLSGVAAQMAQLLADIYDPALCGLIQQLRQAPSAVSQYRFDQFRQEAAALGSRAQSLACRYGRSWGLSC